jgi:hypothetical protein
MDISKFKLVSVEGEGDFRLVREIDLERLIAAATRIEPQPIPETLGALIHLYRTEHRLSLRGLGEKINVDHAHIHKIEKGKIPTPRAEVLAALGGLFGEQFLREIRHLGFN